MKNHYRKSYSSVYTSQLKFALVIIVLVSLFALVQQCFGQDVVLTKKDSTQYKFTIMASSDSQLFAKDATYDFTDILRVNFREKESEGDKSLYQKLKAAGITVNGYKGNVYQSKSDLYIDELPFDENGKLIFSEVVKVDGATAENLFLRSKYFFIETFKSAKDVLQMDNKENGILIGKGFSEITIKAGLIAVATRLYYSIKVSSKEGRYRYEIYDLYFKNYPSQYASEVDVPAETMFKKVDYFKASGKARITNESYRDETLSSMESLIFLIKDSMSKANVKKEDEW